MIASNWWWNSRLFLDPPGGKWGDYPADALLGYFEHLVGDEGDGSWGSLWNTLNRRSFGVWE